MFVVRHITPKPRARLKGASDHEESVLLENYYLPGDLERQIGAFLDRCNNRHCHDSLDNLTPADVYHARGAKTLKMRKEIKVRRTRTRKRRMQHQAAAA